jgi:hypothetical protein
MPPGLMFGFGIGVISSITMIICALVMRGAYELVFTRINALFGRQIASMNEKVRALVRIVVTSLVVGVVTGLLTVIMYYVVLPSINVYEWWVKSRMTEAGNIAEWSFPGFILAWFFAVVLLSRNDFSIKSIKKDIWLRLNTIISSTKPRSVDRIAVISILLGFALAMAAALTVTTPLYFMGGRYLASPSLALILVSVGILFMRGSPAILNEPGTWRRIDLLFVGGILVLIGVLVLRSVFV